MNKIQTYAIILSAGKGIRCNTDIPKQFIKVAGKTILEHTIDIFEKSKKINKIIIVTHPQYHHQCENIILNNNYKKVIKILNGGFTRQESSYIGISSIPEKKSNILIHEAVRPLLSEKIINDCIKALKKYDAVDVAIENTDTIIKTNNKNEIIEIPQRHQMLKGQTPQAFKLETIKKAHQLAVKEKFTNVTDDCGLIMKYKLCSIFVVHGDINNIKITYNDDIFLLDKLFQTKTTQFIKINLNKLKNKVIMVFGSTSGIGKAIYDIAQKHGAKVYGFSRGNNTDITNNLAVKNAFKKVFGIENNIDYVVCTAGILKMGKIENRSTKDIRDEILINYYGSVNVVQKSIKYLKKSRGSILLFTSSSYTRGRALYSIYSSSKAALVNFTQAISEECANDNIRINIMSPERTATPMRFTNFGKESMDTLLKPNTIAISSLSVLLSDSTGQVIDVKLQNY